MKLFHIIFGLVAMIHSGSVLAQVSPEQLKRGKALYHGPGGCFSCHQNNGQGIKGAFPPLAGTPWVTNNPERLITISLYGLNGAIRVNGQTFNGAMPPQTQFDAQQIADILTYIRNSWGNKAEAISRKQVEAIQQKPVKATHISATHLLKRYPFDKASSRKNGLARVQHKDAEINATKVTISRTFMPGSSPAAIVVALPGPQYYCWDAGECRLRYVWKKGGFITNQKQHWSSNGAPVPVYSGEAYYRAINSLITPEQVAAKEQTKNKHPVYDTTQTKDFPLHFKGLKTTTPRYKGYTLKKDGHPEFIYQYGDQNIRELITTTEDKTGIIRHFKITGPPRTILVKTPQTDKAKITCDNGSYTESGILIPDDKSRQFNITIKEISK